MHVYRIVLVCCLLTSAATFAQEDGPAEACFKLVSHAEARACLEARSQQSTLALQHAESSLRSAFAKWDQEPQYRSRSIAAIDESSTRFQQYRESQCEFKASLAAGGNGAGDRRLLCIIELNQQRSAALQAVLTALR